jgi:hypothetical protein
VKQISERKYNKDILELDPEFAKRVLNSCNKIIKWNPEMIQLNNLINDRAITKAMERKDSFDPKEFQKELDSIASTIENEKNKFTQCLMKIVFYSYQCMPLRLELAETIISFDLNQNVSSGNWYIYPHKKFVFNNYKTSEKYGQVEYPIKHKLHSAIIEFLRIRGDKKRNNTPLLVNTKGAQFTRHYLNVMHQTWFTKKFTTLNRKLYAKNNNEISKNSRELKHSIGTHLIYYK